jgi:hypothetical protein
MSCHVAGKPEFEWESLKNYISEVSFHGLKGTNIAYGITAALDAWKDSGVAYDTDEPRWETGCVFGNSAPDAEATKMVINRVDSKEVKKLGSRVVEQTMNSGVTSFISGRLGLGNRVVTNSTACATGTQAILMGYEYIQSGMAQRMVVGSSEYIDPYIFGTFDSMRVLSRKFNERFGRWVCPGIGRGGDDTGGPGFCPGTGCKNIRRNFRRRGKFRRSKRRGNDDCAKPCRRIEMHKRCHNKRWHQAGRSGYDKRAFDSHYGRQARNTVLEPGAGPKREGFPIDQFA